MAARRMTRPVSIIIPVYGDLASLEACIRSVLEHGDLGINGLLLVNDCGPDADAIELRILELIAGVDSARYARNPRNIGFAATCNRAVLELDDSGNDVLLLNSDAVLTPGAVAEMSQVLYAAEKHAVVCPRSNNATIASLPFLSRPHRGPQDIDHSLKKYAAVVDELPRYSVAPVALGFCFMVRRSIVDNFGLFDEIFSPGYSEENEYCLRINAEGYSSLIANRAYVIHEGTRSFRESMIDFEALSVRNQAIVAERYPYFEAAVEHYVEYDMDPVDMFSDFLDPADPHKRVLIDLSFLSLKYDGTVRNALSFLMLLAERSKHDDLDIEFVIASSKEAIDYFDLGRFGFRALWNESVGELFDLGFALAPVHDQEQILRLNRFCARWVITHLDIITTRVLSLLENDIARKQVLRDSFRFADRTVVISEATRTDTLAYFLDLAPATVDRMTVLHQGAVTTDALAARGDDGGLSGRARQAVAAGGYVLAIGNPFPHKQLSQTIDALRGGRHVIVVLGSEAEDLGDNIVPVPAGRLSDRQVSELHDGASVVLYPSAYEGFGLPTAEATRHGKSVILFDTAVSHEVVAALGIADSARFFSRFSELAVVVDDAVAAAGSFTPPSTLRTLDDYNAGLLEIIVAELGRPVDLPRLRERMAHFRAISAYLERPASYLANAVHYLDRLENRRSIRTLDAVAARVNVFRSRFRG
jgi:GT2 family glycosyltransferase